MDACDSSMQQCGARAEQHGAGRRAQLNRWMRQTTCDMLRVHLSLRCSKRRQAWCRGARAILIARGRARRGPVITLASCPHRASEILVTHLKSYLRTCSIAVAAQQALLCI